MSETKKTIAEINALKGAEKYAAITAEYVIDWCVNNNQVEWLQAKATEKVECTVYPRKAVTKENGKTVWVRDKSKEPTKEMRDMTFVNLKVAFVDKFMPEIAPERKAKDEPTFLEKIKAL